ncbi:WD repeat-containing protein 5B [Serendipita indica DSM 11827]|nr:WD repeat-containing protein 5B [Serendipita indica DSM 11827]
MSTRKSNKAKKSYRTQNSLGSYSLPGNSSRNKHQLYDAANVGLDVMGNISEGSELLAPLKAACRTTKSILEAIDSNQEGWSDLARRLTNYMGALENQITLFEIHPIENRAVNEAVSRPLIQYVEFLEDMHDRIIELKETRSRGRLGLFKAFSKVKVDMEEIRMLNQDIEDRHRQLMEALGLFTALHTQVIEQNTKTLLTDVDTGAILQLPTVAVLASSVHTTCMEGTRTAVLQTISCWAEDDTSDKPIFWLCDIAGSGKSTVAMSAVASWRRQGVLGGRFFFSLASSEGSTTDKFCSTIARELVQQMPELGPHIAAVVKQNPDIMRSSIEEQFRALIVHPLHHRQGRTIIVVDALDECKSGSQRRELLETFSKAVRESENLKIFMTSRPDPVIEAVLGPLSIKSKLGDRLHDVKHRDNIDDVALYVHQSLDGILPLDKRQRIVEKANGLFIWASTACRMLTSETILYTPESIYERLVSLNQVGAMDEIYDLVFERMDPEALSVMSEMLALLLVACEPLTTDELEDILKQVGLQGSGRALVKNLGSVLSADESTKLIQFRHPTLVEYLRRCSIVTAVNGRRKLNIKAANAHGQVALWSFKRLKSRTEGLKFNICQLESSFYLNREISDLDARISKFIPRKLRYASSNWLFHVAETDDYWRSALKSELEHIMQIPYVLYWMEILSFTGGVPQAIADLRTVTRHARIEEKTRSDMTEIRRFLMAFSVPIQDSAPHIYISALPFTPVKSKMHLCGLDIYKNTLKVTRGLEDMYHSLPRTLVGHNGSVNSVAFSPDSSRIVSGSEDRKLRLWDADTGQPLGEPIRGHYGSVNAVAFSPDSSRIVSGSNDGSIRLWDAHTGKPSGTPIWGHEDIVLAVQFSPCGSQIVSSSRDHTIRVWDADTSQPLGGPIRGHQDSVNAVEFSPDGSQIVSGSSDGTIRLWDADTDQPLGEPIRGHNNPVTAVAFSPDGLRVVSGSQDGTIRIWHADTGQPLGGQIRGHENSVNAVKFSRDGSQIVSCSHDEVIRIWDANTGQQLGRSIWGHASPVLTVAFSPDDSRIVSGAYERTIRLWDADTGQSLGEPIRGHQDSINAIEFSPDGSRIVSSSVDKTIRLWDTITGQPLGDPILGHTGSVNTVALSPDGSRIVSGSEDMTLRLWDAGTGRPLGEPIRGHQGRVFTVGFSPDCFRILSGSEDMTLRLWDADTGQPLGVPIRGHQDSVRAVKFSPNGSLIVSGSNDATIRLWDADTGQPLGEPIRGHRGSVTAVDFSPDGLRIVSGSQDKTIRLWTQPLVSPVAFSPNGSRIVSSSLGKTIRLWNANTGQQLGEAIRGHQKSVAAVKFSPDGSKIISGSDDKTIRLWNIETGRNTINTKKDYMDHVSSAVPPESFLKIHVPGFNQCVLLQDGWVQSSDSATSDYYANSESVPRNQA